MKTRDFLGNEWEIDCMGCAISNGVMPVPGGFIRRTQHFCVHQDPLIPLPGFLVIASLRHIRSIDEMQAAEYQEFSGLLRAAHTAIRQVTQIEYLTILQKEISIHFHLWFFPWTQGVIERYGSPSIAKIREIMADYRKGPIGKEEWEELEKLIEKIRTLLKES